MVRYLHFGEHATYRLFIQHSRACQRNHHYLHYLHAQRLYSDINPQPISSMDTWLHYNYPDFIRGLAQPSYDDLLNMFQNKAHIEEKEGTEGMVRVIGKVEG